MGGRTPARIDLARIPKDWCTRSDETAAAIDEEVRNLVDQAYRRAKEVLVGNRHILDNLAEMLVEKETVDADELQDIIANNDVTMAALA